MVQRYMKCLLVSRTLNKGFTLLEMMIGISMTVTVSALALTALSNAESGFTKDKNKIEGGQKLSSVLDIVGRDIVQAGEQVNEPRFPVIKVIPDGAKGSRIVVYRGLEEALSTCSTIPAGVPVASLSIGLAVTTSTNLSCNPATVPPAAVTATSYPIYPDNVTAWKAKSPAPASPVKFLLHNGLGNLQEINLTAITPKNTSDTLQPLNLTVLPFTPAVEFKEKSTAYIVEKTEYLICNNVLISRVNNIIEKDTDPGASGSCTETGDQPIATNVTKMDIVISTATTAAPVPADGTNINFPCAPAIPAPNPRGLCPVVTETLDWRNLRGVTATITAANPDANLTPPLVASGRFYPRNILSTNAQ
jgi:prepilin-type N-terminal cleavage/methylation domain-containing protein